MQVTTHYSEEIRPPRNPEQFERVYEHLVAQWLPVDIGLVRELRALLHQSDYILAPERVIRELKRDFPLFLYVIRQLAIAQGAVTSPGDGYDPIDLLCDCNLRELDAILWSAESLAHFSGATSTNTLEPDKDQSVALIKTMSGASVSELLAENAGISPDLAYACALFRQLGLTLLSWHYSFVYRKVITELSSDESIDEKFSSILGFSPTLLGFTIARRINMPSYVVRGIGRFNDLDVSGKSASEVQDNPLGETLCKICELGELFVRLQGSNDTSNELPEQVQSLTEMLEALGPDYEKRIKARLLENCERYTWKQPFLLEYLVRPLPISRARALDDSVRVNIEANQYLRLCPADVREQLESLYRILAAPEEQIQQQRREVLKAIKHVAPRCGFPRGCIYLVEPSVTKLLPKFTWGDIDSHRLVSVNHLETNATGLLAKAYRSNAPLLAKFSEPLRNNLNSNQGDDSKVDVKEDIGTVVGVLGETQRVGLLYLEYSESNFKERHANVMICFKAIEATLAACLGIR